MASKFRIISSILLFHLLYTSAFSQTYLSPIVGYELTRYNDHFREHTNNIPYYLTPSTQNNINLLFGIEIQQVLGKKISAAFQYTWSKKHVKAVDTFNDLPVSGIAYRYNRNLLLIKYRLENNLSVGIGHSFNFYKKTSYVPSPSQSLSRFRSLLWANNKLDHALALSLSYQIAKLSIELQYHHSYRIVETSPDFPTLFLPPKAISLSVSYKFKLLEKPSFSGWGRKKEGCPTF